MNFFINQDIDIKILKIQGLSNSSVLQVGSSGMIKPISNLYNTGEFTAPGPTLDQPSYEPSGSYGMEAPYVPLPAPS